MTEAQDHLARIGAAIDHAVKLQNQAEAAHKAMAAQTLSLQKTVAQLLIGIEERSNALGAQEQRLATQITAFTKQVEQLGPQAFAGGKAAVAGEVRAALKDAAAVVGAAAEEVTAPVRETLTASLAAIDEAQALFAEARERLSWRALGLIGATALGALALIILGIWALLSWQRAELANLAIQKADLQGEIEGMKAISQRMQAQGLKIEFSDCKENNGRIHRCVAVRPDMSMFGTVQAPFYVLKGY